MSQAIRSVLRAGRRTVGAFAPELVSRIDSFRGDRAYRRLDEIVDRLVAEQGLEVAGGPFKGLKYVRGSSGSMLAPKLIGSYEEELHGLVTLLCRTPYELILNIGCGEGYYAVGLAMATEVPRILAYDGSEKAQALCRQMVELNGVSDRVEVRGLCTAADLSELSGKRALIVCDCEGFEREIFTEQTIPPLARCDVLMELHRFMDPTTPEVVVERFRPTHEATLINSRPRNPERYGALAGFSRADQALALSEFRYEGMDWAYLASLRVE